MRFDVLLVERNFAAVHCHDLVFAIQRPTDQALHTSMKRMRATKTGNHNGNFLRSFQLATHPESVRAPLHAHSPGFTAAAQMFFQRSPRGFKLPRFLANINGAGAIAPPPVIKNPRNMMNAVGSLDQPKQKIVILRAVEFWPAAAQLPDRIAT